MAAFCYAILVAVLLLGEVSGYIVVQRPGTGHPNYPEYSYYPEVQYQYYSPEWYWYPPATPPPPPPPHMTRSQAEPFLQLYYLIHSINTYRYPAEHTTELDQVIGELQDESLQESLYELLSDVEGFKELTMLGRYPYAHFGYNGLLDQSFVNDYRQLIPAIHRALGSIDLRNPMLDYSTREKLSQLRQHASALTVSTMDKELQLLRELRLTTEKPWTIRDVLDLIFSKQKDEAIADLATNYEVAEGEDVDEPFDMDGVDELWVVIEDEGKSDIIKKPSAQDEGAGEDWNKAEQPVVQHDLLDEFLSPEAETKSDHDIVDVNGTIAAPQDFEAKVDAISEDPIDIFWTHLNQITDPDPFIVAEESDEESDPYEFKDEYYEQPASKEDSSSLDTDNSEAIAVEGREDPLDEMPESIPNYHINEIPDEAIANDTSDSIETIPIDDDSEQSVEISELLEENSVEEANHSFNLSRPEDVLLEESEEIEDSYPEEPEDDISDFEDSQETVNSVDEPAPMQTNAPETEIVESKEDEIGEDNGAEHPKLEVEEEEKLQETTSQTEPEKISVSSDGGTDNVPHPEKKDLPEDDKENNISIPEQKPDTEPIPDKADSDLDTLSKVSSELIKIVTLLEETAGFLQLKEFITNDDLNRLSKQLVESEFLETSDDTDALRTEVINVLQLLIVERNVPDSGEIFQLLEFWKSGIDPRLDDKYFEKTYGVNEGQGTDAPNVITESLPVEEVVEEEVQELINELTEDIGKDGDIQGKESEDENIVSEESVPAEIPTENKEDVMENEVSTEENPPAVEEVPSEKETETENSVPTEEQIEEQSTVDAEVLPEQKSNNEDSGDVDQEQLGDQGSQPEVIQEQAEAEDSEEIPSLSSQATENDVSSDEAITESEEPFPEGFSTEAEPLEVDQPSTDEGTLSEQQEPTAETVPEPDA